jgi:hypothetical protein
MPWSDITKKDAYQNLKPGEQQAIKSAYFEKKVAPRLAKLPDPERQAIFSAWMQTPDDSGQGYITSLLSSAGRGATSFIPGAIGGVGEIVGSDTLVDAADATEEAIEGVLPINPIYKDNIGIKGANIGGQVFSTLGTGGVGGAVGKALAGTRAIRTGAQTAALGSAFLSGTREGGQEARKYNMEGVQAYLRALGGGATELATEKLLFGMGTELAPVRKMLGDTVEKGAGSVGKAVYSEAGEEAAAQLGGNIATTLLAPEGTKTPGLLEGTGEAALGGGFGGLLFGGANLLAGSEEVPTIESGELPIPPELRSRPPMVREVEVPGVGKVQFDARVVQPDAAAGMTPEEVQEFVAAGAAKVVPPPPVDEPPEVQQAVESVNASADVAPQLAEALNEVMADPPTIETQIEQVETPTPVAEEVAVLPAEPQAVGETIPPRSEVAPIVAASRTSDAIRLEFDATGQPPTDEQIQEQFGPSLIERMAPDIVSGTRGTQVIKITALDDKGRVSSNAAKDAYTRVFGEDRPIKGQSRFQAVAPLEDRFTVGRAVAGDQNAVSQLDSGQTNNTDDNQSDIPSGRDDSSGQLAVLRIEAARNPVDQGTPVRSESANQVPQPSPLQPGAPVSFKQEGVRRTGQVVSIDRGIARVRGGDGKVVQTRTQNLTPIEDDSNRAPTASAGAPEASGQSTFASHLRSQPFTAKWSDSDIAAAQAYADTGIFDNLEGLSKVKRNAVVRELTAFSADARQQQEQAEAEERRRFAERNKARPDDAPTLEQVLESLPNDIASASAGRSRGVQPYADVAYMAAVEAGDMEGAQRMVDQAAREAGYEIQANHGTNTGFNSFSTDRLGSNTGAASAKRAFFFAGKEETANSYRKGSGLGVDEVKKWRSPKDLSSDPMAAPILENALEYGVAPSWYAKERGVRDQELDAIGAFKRHLSNDPKNGRVAFQTAKTEALNAVQRLEYGDVDFVNRPLGGRLLKASLKMQNPLVVDYAGGQRFKTFNDVLKEARASGHDGAIFKNVRDGGPVDTIYAVFDPNQIKSADPVTRDDQGNVIPLSQRFQTDNPDIRYSQGQPAPDTTFQGDPQQVLRERLGLTNFKNIIFGNYRPMANGSVLKGFVRQSSNKVYLNLAAIENADDLVDVFLEEASHLIWTDPAVAAEWARLKELVPQDKLDALRAKFEKLGYTPEVWDEEAFNEIARENGLDELQKSALRRAWDAIVAAVRRAFGLSDDTEINRISGNILRYAIRNQQDMTEAAAEQGERRSVNALRTSKNSPTDAEYLRAVEAGDMATAQRIVDEAAREAGYNVGPVYHGTEQKGLTEFFGGWWSKDKKTTREFGSQQYKAFLKGPLADGDTLRELYIDWHGDDLAPDTEDEDSLTDQEIADVAMSGNRFTDFIREKGYRGIEVWDDSNMVVDMAYAVFESEQIKSADPVVRDDEGRIIPPSERFQSDNADIRYSMRGPTVRESDFGNRTMVDERRTQEFRDQPPSEYEVRGQQKVNDEAREIIKAQGREAALAAFQNESSDIRPEVRIAGLMQLAMQFDALANLQRLKGNDAGTDAFDSLMERAVEAKAALEDVGNVTGRNLAMFNTWARLSPDGVLRKFERIMEKEAKTRATASFGADYDTMVKELKRLREDFRKETGLTKSELQQAWEIFSQSNMDASARKAVYDAFKNLRPRKVSTSADKLNKLFANPGSIRDKMNQGGENLVRNFFQMMAGPRPQAGPLTEFDASIQQALGQMLRKVMAEQGLVNEHESLQMKDIDRLVRSVSADPLRFDKIAAADAKMQAELDAIEDDSRRETLRQAWEEATSQMVTNIGGEPTIRRVVNQQLKTAKPEWNKLFDAGKPDSTDALKKQVVDAVMAQVEAKLTDADRTTDNNLSMLRDEVEGAFDRIRDVKHAQWLEHREQVAATERAKARKKDFLEALRGKGVAERALDRLSKVLSDTPSAPGKGTSHPVQVLIGEHIKAPVDDFVEQMVGLGIPTIDAENLNRAINENRRRGEMAAREKALQQALDILKPRTATARKAVPKLVSAILRGADKGILGRTELAQALAKSFGIPVMTPQQRQEFADLAAEINALPEGVLREQKAIEFNNKLALFEGIPAMDALISMWYANILSGLSTQGVNFYGNGVILALRAAATMIGSGSVSDTAALIRGMTKDGVKRGLQEMRNTFRDGIQHKTLKYDDQQKINSMELIAKIPWAKRTPLQKAITIATLNLTTRYVFRAMGAVDALFWHTAQEGMMHMAVNRALRKQGLKPGTAEFNAESLRQLGGGEEQFIADMEQAKQELTDAGQQVNPQLVMRRAWELRLERRSQNVKQGGARWADRMTSQQQPEGIGHAITNLIGVLQRVKFAGIPIFVPLVPFNRIVSNLLEGGLDFAGVGILRGLLGHHLTDKNQTFDELERRERFMAGVMGLVAMGVIYALNEAYGDEPDEDATFRWWGPGPKDKAEKEKWLASGARPYTFKAGKYYVNYAESPLSMPGAALGGWLDSIRYGKNMDKKSGEQRAAYAFLAAIRGFSNQGVLSGIANLFDVVSGEAQPSQLMKIGPQTATGFVPAQGFLRDTSTLFDPNKIDDSTMRGAFIKDIPVLKSYGKPSLNVFGEPVEIKGLPVVRRFVVKQDLEPVYAWLGRNDLNVPMPPPTIEIGKYLPSKMQEPAKRRAMQLLALENGVMTPEQRYEFVQRSGQLTKQGIEALMKTTQTVDPKMREKYQDRVKKITADARERAMRELVMKIK